MGAFAGGVYITTALPNVGDAPNLTIIADSAKIERGKYLANHVAVCIDCHSTRNWDLFAAPMEEGTAGAGGEVFSKEMGFPGTFYAPNITPYELSSWSDGEIFRAITTGVSKDGDALFPLMASHRFGQMSKEDIESIIVYLRTLTPLVNDVPRSQVDFPVNILINTMPKKQTLAMHPSKTYPIEYGAYLVNAAGCVDCHSKTDKGSVIAGTEFGGGMEFKQPVGTVRSPNITFHENSGIGNWTEEMFIAKFKSYADTTFKPSKIEAGHFNTPMPWTMYGGMDSDDLKAIYAYLKSIKPIDNTVERFTPKK